MTLSNLRDFLVLGNELTVEKSYVICVQTIQKGQVVSDVKPEVVKDED